MNHPRYFVGFLLLTDDERDVFVIGGEALIGTLQHTEQSGIDGDTSSVAGCHITK